jgi:hypothetical protein
LNNLGAKSFIIQANSNKYNIKFFNLKFYHLLIHEGTVFPAMLTVA